MRFSNHEIEKYLSHAEAKVCTCLAAFKARLISAFFFEKSHCPDEKEAQINPLFSELNTYESLKPYSMRIALRTETLQS